jgi:DNA-directed RNA polymerase
MEDNMKDPLSEVVDYLITKVSSVNMNNPKANKGAQILRTISKYKDNIPSIVQVAFDKMSSNFTREYPEQPVGLAKTTQVSVSIGEHVFTKYFNTKCSFHQAIRTGDLILEAYVQSGFIIVKRAEGFGAYNAQAPYMIEPTSRWEEIGEFKLIESKGLLVYTLDEMPEDISNIMQPKNYPLIKRWGISAPQSQKDAFNEIFIDSPFVRAANKLQQTSWKINPKVLAVLLNNLDSIMPKDIPMYSKAIPKSLLKTAYEKYQKNPSAGNKSAYNLIAKEWEKTLRPLQVRAKRAEIKTTIGKAKQLAEWDKFYSLVDLDYRGRVYYKEPYMNYQGNDIARGIMSFSEGKVINDAGKRALAIHTANSYNEKYDVGNIPDWVEEDYQAILVKDGIDTISVDKFSLEDRINWFNNNWDLIESTADQGILHDCEKTVVFLACCIEWCDIADMEDKGITPTSSVPVAIDGTCNGYQHAAAMSRDDKTGSLVALSDSAVPHDLYVKVAQKLVELAPEFFKTRPMSYAEIRKLISKRATMTRAYSAGAQTIAESMYSDCVQAGADELYNITQIDCDELAVHIVKAIETVCPGSQTTMKFLQDLAQWELGTFEYQTDNGDKVSHAKINKYKQLARMANKEQKANPTVENTLELNKINSKISECKLVLVKGHAGEDIRWMTKSGFPVIYKVNATRQDTCKSTLRGVIGGASKQPGRINHVAKIYLDTTNRREASAGISPNYIHSQDATHMALVIDEFGVNFGAVHDSFSCHASDVDKLKQITQDKFVEMYSDDNPLEAVKRYITNNDCTVEVPELGDLEIDNVLGSRNFFS